MMKKINIACGILVVAAIAFTACGNKKKSNAELFREYYSKNLHECVRAAEQSGVPKEEAERKCACMLTKLYELDSTFVRKSEKEATTFIQQHMVELYTICDSL